MLRELSRWRAITPDFPDDSCFKIYSPEDRAMTAAPVFSFAGLLLLLFGGAFSGLPLGIPPGEFDPVMARVAPQECLFYVGWSGTAEPSAKSANRTEQLVADPGVQPFVE